MDFSLKIWLEDQKENIVFWWEHFFLPTIKAPYRWIRHAYQRIRYGVSYKDAWNVDYWLSEMMPKILMMLKKNTCSYPTCILELHNQIAEIDGVEKLDKIPGENAEEGSIELYGRDLDRMAFLFKEYDEDLCSMKNRYESEVDQVETVWHDVPSKIPGAKSMEVGRTDEQKEIWENYCKDADRIAQYRLECLHKAIKMLDVYVENLWD